MTYHIPLGSTYGSIIEAGRPAAVSRAAAEYKAHPSPTTYAAFKAAAAGAHTASVVASASAASAVAAAMTRPVAPRAQGKVARNVKELRLLGTVASAHKNVVHRDRAFAILVTSALSSNDASVRSEAISQLRRAAASAPTTAARIEAAGHLAWVTAHMGGRLSGLSAVLAVM